MCTWTFLQMHELYRQITGLNPLFEVVPRAALSRAESMFKEASRFGVWLYLLPVQCTKKTLHSYTREKQSSSH